MADHISPDERGKNEPIWPDWTELDTKLSVSQVFDVLADERRRRLLFYLHNKDGDVASLGELVDYLVVHEAESVADLEDDDVTISLYHTHLPKLTTLGLIEYDRRSETVRYRSDDAVVAYLENAANENRERP